MLIKIASSNLKKNFSFYKLYILSLTIIISIYVMFQSFANDAIMLSKISSDGRVESMSNTINIFFIGFVIFFMLYFNSFFLKKRSKELGIYSLLGFSKKKISLLLVYESTILTIISFLLSILLGSTLYIVVNKLLITVLEIRGVSLNQFINTTAVYNSFLLILIMTITIIISNIYELKKLTLINLVNLSKKKEKRIKNRPIVGVIGFLLLILGYSISINIIKGTESIWAKIGYMPIAFLVLCSTVLGTVIVIRYSVALILSKIRGNKNILYTEISNVVIPRFTYRMNSKSKILIVVTLLVSATTSMLSCLVLSLYFPVKATERINPSAIEYTLNNEEARKSIKRLNNSYNFNSNTTEILELKSYSEDKVPYEYTKKENHSFDVISESTFKQLLESQKSVYDFNKLKSGEGIFINYYPNDESLNQEYKLKLGNTSESKIIKVVANTIKNPISFQNSIATLVVSDDDYNDMKLENSIERKTIFSLNGEGLRDDKEFYNDVHKIIKDTDKGFASSYSRNSMIKEANGSTFLLLSFITILFFITTGNMLYFTNVVETLNVKSEYFILSKMGYSLKHMKKIIRREIFLMYSIPLGIGILNGLFALICYRYMLVDNLLGSLSILKFPLIYTGSIFTIVYTIFYAITIRACEKSALKVE
ncbi:FtsX-like permease family protein [Paraclostridium bifermentans]|uniref:FtsX-like permease family protein n=1 Tax=Paraclostridium bifermentans TaxID=1490 RepID=UPI0018AB39B8|nr:FtsX-like permease family protein [Paraclostridium bifermentans]